MARAQGARAQMALAYETVYGTPPVSGFRLMPFARATLGAEQPLLESELLGYGRDPLAPIRDAVTADGEVVIPIDVEAFGYWLKAAFGQPTTTGTTPKTHTFQSGNWTLPSMAVEVAMPEVPRFAMYSGCVLDQLSWQMQRSGLLTATARLVAQGETIATATAAGTPATLGLQRFGHFNGTVKRNGTALGNVVSAEITYSNNLDRIETIRGDGRIDGADPTMAALTGRIEVRFSDATLVTQAIDGSPCELEFNYSLGANASFTFTAHAVYLPIPRIEIGGPQGVQASFDWQAAKATPEEAERRCRRALMEAWVGRESAVFRLPPSRLALDPCDVILLDHDGRLSEMRLISIADAASRGIEAIRQDRAIYDLPPGGARPASIATPTVFGAPEVLMLDLPQLREDQPAHRPLVALHSQPWPGEMAIMRSSTSEGFELLARVRTRARIGRLVADLPKGPVGLFDRGTALIVDLFTGTLASVSISALLGGANSLAVESSPGVWEIVQAGEAELMAAGRYRLTLLLRGQRGTESAMGDPTPAGARVVVLDNSLAALPIALEDIGLAWNWRIGRAARPLSDASVTALTFTPQGIGLRPFSPAHLRAQRQPDGARHISWIRRTRDLAGDSWVLPEVPLGEAVEAYDLEIRDPGGALLRKVGGLAAPGFTYTAAMIADDLGGAATLLTIRVLLIFTQN